LISWKKALVRPYDFENGTRVERLYYHRIDPTKCVLNEKEQNHFNKVRQAMLYLLQKDRKPTEIVFKLQHDLGIGEVAARNLVEAAKIVYPDLFNEGKKLEKEDAVATLHAIIKRRTHEKSSVDDDSIIIKSIEAISKIREWGKEENNFDPSELLIPLPIFTSDVAALDMQLQKTKPEEVDYEEIDSTPFIEHAEE